MSRDGSTPGLTVEQIPELGRERFDEITGGAQDPFETDFLGLVWADKDLHFVVRSEGRLAAHAGLVVLPMTVGRERFDVAGLGTVIVSEKMRGHGLARMAVAAAVDHARDVLGVPFGLLFCLDSRVGLYRRLGWRLVEGDVTVGQPGGEVVMGIRTMWIPLRDGIEWPEGPVRLRALPM
ncbi:GNAT family N-acetyltransferase [Phytomonospora sp. NPDC050363]|uniref:GNAT family N-acetyltransferase n=1 Tax=Phytomonospora sp. NPDC050363 TaxID=3155642 RepID=UPI0033D8CFA9